MIEAFDPCVLDKEKCKKDFDEACTKIRENVDTLMKDPKYKDLPYKVIIKMAANKVFGTDIYENVPEA